MNNILIIAYYYPPKGGAGVQRTSKFANYLSKLGYNVSVLTVREDEKGLVDKSLKDDVSSDIKVYRTSIKSVNVIDKINRMVNKKGSSKATNKENTGSDKLKLIGIKQKIISKFRRIAKNVFLSIYNLIYIPDDKKGWIHSAVEEGKKIIKSDKIDVIFTTSGPYTSHIIGYKLAKNIDIKWIADFRDPWVDNPFVHNSFIVNLIYKNLEKKVVKRSDKVLSVSKPIIADFMKRYKNEDKSKFKIITNGYDEEDFKNLKLNPENKDGRFKILYNGTLYGKRSPEKVLKAIDNLIKSDKVNRDMIKIKFLGQIGNEHSNIVEYFKFKYPEVIEHENYVPHKESLKELCSADALLLIIEDGKGSNGIYTGKIFEYIRTGKPILGMVPDGVAKDLILNTKTGYIAHPMKYEEIEKMILDCYLNFINKDNSLDSNWEEIEKYSRENLTKKLIKIINEIQ